MNIGRRRKLTLWLTCAAVASLAVSALASRAESQARMAQMAKRTAAGPIKLDVRPEMPVAVLDSTLDVHVYLRNANNESVSWDRPCKVTLKITYPSKRVVEQQIFIAAGQSSGVAKVEAAEYGVAQIQARESSDSLLSAGNTLFVH